MDLSPDIDPTEISRNYLINYPDYSNFILFGQAKDKDTQLDKLRSSTLKFKMNKIHQLNVKNTKIYLLRKETEY